MPGTRYQCADRYCDYERVIPERPSEADTIRMGCPKCSLLRQFYPAGTPRPNRPAGAGCP